MALERYIVGLTGNISSGKSKATERFKYLGAEVLDVDKVAHKLYDPYNNSLVTGDECYKKVIEHFGENVDNNGVINRGELGKIVFGDKNKLAELSNLVWPYVRQETENILNQMNGIIIVEAAVLYEAGWQSYCDKIITVATDDDIRIERLMKRNNLTKEEAQKRMDAQTISQDEKVSLSDFVIYNNANLIEGKEFTDEDPLFVSVKKVYEQLQKELTKGQ